MSKIIGVTVGTTLPKPNFNQTDPTKGDYIKNKPDLSVYATTEYVDDAVAVISDLVGDTSVASQIETAIEANGTGIKSMFTITDSTTVGTGGTKEPEWQSTQFTFGDGTTWDYFVDATLTRKWQAADAKSVGDALTKKVSFTEAQELTDEQKQQAQDNIGFSEADALAIILATDLTPSGIPIAEDDSIYTDENGAIYTL